MTNAPDRKKKYPPRLIALNREGDRWEATFKISHDPPLLMTVYVTKTYGYGFVPTFLQRRLREAIEFVKARKYCGPR